MQLQKKILITSLILMWIMVLCNASDSFYTKITHGFGSEARCFDGSYPSLYYHEGGDTKKILIYFQPGGICANINEEAIVQTCMKNPFMTSNFRPDHPQISGILSTDPNKSNFSHWTKIQLNYCDGALHQGYRSKPLQYNGTKMYFRGAVNTRLHLSWINARYPLSQAEKIVVAGSSAGGIAVIQWVDYIKDLVRKPGVVKGVVDAGMFYSPAESVINPRETVDISHLSKEMTQTTIMETQHVGLLEQLASLKKLSSLSQGMIWSFKQLMLLSNADQNPPNGNCLKYYGQHEYWKCFFTQYAYATLDEPLLFVNSNYDQWVLSNAFQLSCLQPPLTQPWVQKYSQSLFLGKQIAYTFYPWYTIESCSQNEKAMIEGYSRLFISQLVHALIKHGHSVWTISCVEHTTTIFEEVYNSQSNRVPAQTGINVRQAVQNFVLKDQKIQLVDELSWPNNQACSS